MMGRRCEKERLGEGAKRSDWAKVRKGATGRRCEKERLGEGVKKSDWLTKRLSDKRKFCNMFDGK